MKGIEVLLIVLFLILIGAVVFGGCSQKSGFIFDNRNYQYSNPNVDRQYHYYKCIANECAGNTHNYDCLEKCHLKTFRKGMKAPDIQSRVCEPLKHDEDQFYKCLDSVYTGYRYP